MNRLPTEMERRCATALAKSRRCAFEDDSAECKPNAGEVGFVCFCLRDARAVVRAMLGPPDDVVAAARENSDVRELIAEGTPPICTAWDIMIDAASPPE